jgi:hypothetical protein
MKPIIRETGYVGPEYRFVTPEHGPRPAGSPDECFYCRAPLGAEHQPTCVMRERYVVVLAMVAVRIPVPESWDKEQIEFARNEGSWCADNLSLEPSEGCMCSHMDIRYVGEWNGDALQQIHDSRVNSETEEPA